MDSEKDLTMTDMQKSFWFLSTLNADSPDNIIRFSISLKGSLTPEKLADALNEVIDRNRYLKVTFRDRGGQPQMEGADGRVAPVPFLKVSGEAPLSDSISGFIADTARIPPGEFPLFRHRAFSVNDGEWVVLFAFHHIIFDGPSIPLFAEQLLNAVTGCAGAAPANVASVAGHLNRLVASRFQANTDFWKSYPARERQERPALDWSGAPGSGEFSINLDEKGMAEFSRMAEELDTTAYFCFLHLFSLSISLYFDLKEFSILTPVSMRFSPESARCIGCMINSVPVAVAREDGDTLSGYAGRFLEQLTRSMNHRTYPFINIVEAAGPERLPGRNPFSDFIVSYQKNPFGALKAGGCEMQVRPLPESPAGFLLVIDGIEAGGGCSIRVIYRKDLLEDAALAGFENTVRTVLKEFSASKIISDIKTEIFRPRGAAAGRSPLPGAAATVSGGQGERFRAEALRFWKQLLKNEEIGLDSNFFSVGGTSMKVLQFLAWEREQGINITLLDFFKNPAINRLSALIDKPAAPAMDITSDELDALGDCGSGSPEER